MKTWRGLRASATSRSNSSGVSLTSSPSRVTVCAGTSMVIWLPGGPMVSISGAASSPRRSRARIRATSSLGLNGLTT